MNPGDSEKKGSICHGAVTLPFPHHACLQHLCYLHLSTQLREAMTGNEWVTTLSWS